MSSPAVFEPEELIAKGRSGDQAAVAALIAQYHGYLALLARLQIGRQVQSKVDCSDLVQETCLQVHRTFEQFRGTTEAEYMHWLRKVMACVVANTIRRYARSKRDVHLEQRLQDEFDRSSHEMGQLLIARDSSPSQVAMRRERAKILADALAQLPDHYREVLILHHLEGLSMTDVAQQMGRTANSVQKLWARAVVRLRQLLRDPP